MKWTESAIQRTLAVPGVVEFRAYRAATGPDQVVTTCEFADMVAWATWYMNEDSQRVLAELHTLALRPNAPAWNANLTARAVQASWRSAREVVGDFYDIFP
jgi:hypothetical protein